MIVLFPRNPSFLDICLIGNEEVPRVRIVFFYAAHRNVGKPVALGSFSVIVRDTTVCGMLLVHVATIVNTTWRKTGRGAKTKEIITNTAIVIPLKLSWLEPLYSGYT